MDSLSTCRDLIKKGRYADAEALARPLLAEAETAADGDSLRFADVLDVLVEALWRGGKAKDPSSRERAEHAIRIKEKALGPDHPGVAQSLNNLASLLRVAGDYARTRPLADRALSIREKALGPDHPDVAQSLSLLASLLLNTGDNAGARLLAERALAIREKALGPDHPLVAESLLILAGLVTTTGDYAAARSLLERALAIWEKALGPDHPLVAQSLNNLAHLLYSTGDYAAARPLHERALAIREKEQGPDHPDVAQSLTNLAALLHTMGDYAAARPHYERALAIREKALGPNHTSVANSLSSLALLFHAMGDYAAARPLYEQALAIDEKALGPNHTNVANSLGSLARLLHDTGDLAAARPLYERALAIQEKSQGPDHRAVAQSLQSLALLLQDTRDYAGARPLYERALAIREKALGPDHREVATSLGGLATLLDNTGDYARARPLYERALAIREKALGPDHREVATSLHNLAGLLHATGDYAGARPLLERALAIREKVLGPNHPFVARSLSSLAELFLAQGQGLDAAVIALRAEQIGREHFRLTARTLSERHALSYASVRPSGLDVALSLAGDGLTPEVTRKIWNSVVRSRTLVLDEIAGRHRQVSEITGCSADYASAGARLANLQVRGPGNERPEVYRGLLEDARRQMEETERRLADACVGVRNQQSSDRIGFEDVASALPVRTALVAFVRFSRHPSPRTAHGQDDSGAQQSDRDTIVGTPAPVPAYVAFVLSGGDREPVVVPLGRAAEVDSLVSHWQEEARRGVVAVGRIAPRVEAAYRAKGEALRRRIWDPIASQLRGAERVFVIPDGALNLVSFASLPVNQFDYLVEVGPLIHFLSAERDLVPMRPEPRSGQGLLALGGPDFSYASIKPRPGTAPQWGANSPPSATSNRSYRGERSGCLEFRAMQFQPLPASGREVEDIASLWMQPSMVRDGGADVVQVTGPEATEMTFKKLAPGRRVLHLATHGFFLDGRCPTALGSDPDIGQHATSGGRAPPPVSGENPLLFSGLALAGANQREHSGPNQDDGILTAQEIAALDLSGVEWAVLSACESGVGEVRAGEGVFGLRRAFQVAGAKTLIMSLWSVEDDSARKWMKRLYEARLVKHLSTAEAVRDASLELLRERRANGESTHPFYWGAFVAAGNWR